jgi:hypothetical protein
VDFKQKHLGSGQVKLIPAFGICKGAAILPAGLVGGRPGLHPVSIRANNQRTVVFWFVSIS